MSLAKNVCVIPLSSHSALKAAAFFIMLCGLDPLYAENSPTRAARPPEMAKAEPDLLSLYQKRSAIPQRVLTQLQDWGSLPSWARQTASYRTDWLEELHSNVTRENWPVALRRATVRSVEGQGGASPGISFLTPHKAIGIFDSTPVYLRELFEIVNHPLVPPPSPEPHAKMLISEPRRAEAARRLASFLGMMEETEFVDGLSFEWTGATVAGTRFIYYHELGHLSLSVGGIDPSSIELYPIEDEYRDELAADQFALSMISLEFRNQPELQPSAFTGICLAMMLIASLEYSETVQIDGVRSIKGATLRMGRLLHWTRLGVDLGAVDPTIPGLLQSYWDLFRDLLRSIEALPSPVSSLLRQTAAQPTENWRVARDRIVKWCAFGNCNKVGSALRTIYEEALVQASKVPEAKRVATVVEFLLEATSSLEPDLGLRAAISEGQ